MSGWDAALTQLTSEVLAFALVGLRVLPVVMLCPLLGGQLAPVPVRLAVAVSLGLAVRPLVGPAQLADITWIQCSGEAALGLGLGLVSALPFEGARIGGRLIDLFRGTSAEAALPGAGHRESAGGELLHRLLLAMALSSGALPILLRALARTFRLLPPGFASPAPPGAVAGWVGVAMGTGFAVAAPVLVLCWVVDGALALMARVAPGIPLPEVAPPGRILGGAGVLWLGLGLVCDRLLTAVVSTPEAWAALLAGGR
jgi:flagellar biosynthesis protein FliR